MPDFVPAIELNAALYQEVVAPALSQWRHSCGLLGWGSDVLGYDTPMSTDHGWGPRLLVFVERADADAATAAVDTSLPSSFRGWPVRYADPAGVVRHYVSVTSLDDWLPEHFGLDPRGGLTNIDWLVLAQQQLLGVVRGAVYHDGLAALEPLRRQLSWFPPDVELWMVASQWRRIWQDEAFVGRASEVGDELGSMLLAGRLVRDLMRLCFLFAGRYWPYNKWFGTAFAELPDDDGLAAELAAALLAPDYPRREAALVAAYERVAARHNAWGRTDPIDFEVRDFHDRPFKVLVAEGSIEDLCVERIEDPTFRALPLVGAVDQATDSTDVASYPQRAAALRAWYAQLPHA